MDTVLASSQQQDISKTPAKLAAQKKLDEARAKLKLEHTEAARAVVDPSTPKSPRLTARQRAKHLKLTASADILTAAAAHMLKSTHKPAARLGSPPFPEGWTEHKAPTGQAYYYNDSTKQSTYVRPSQAIKSAVQIPHQASSGIIRLPDSGHDLDYSFGVNGVPRMFGGIGNHPYGNRNDHRGRGHGRGGHVNQQNPQLKDRSKSKYDIPGCQPWILVKTKLGRRYVYNPEKHESFWRFPPEVLEGVIKFDRQEQEKRIKQNRGEIGDAEHEEKAVGETVLATATNGTPTAARGPETSLATNPQTDRPALDSDDEDYEEVEVTDNEDEENPSKRQKTEVENLEQPVEFDEDDIAFQLAAMGQDYGLDPGEYGDGSGEELVEGAEGLALTDEDANALFKDMLNDHGISPYTTWEKVVEAGYIVDDERYTVLPNMRSRKEVWSDWVRATIQRLKEQREKEEKKDPKIPYFAFLQKNATPKLYWPEFRRKYKKEPEMHNNKISDKDREKSYRNHISRLKLPEATMKSDLVKLLKLMPLSALNKSISIHALPASLLTDLRYISLRPAIRDPMIEAHISTLPPAPTDLKVSPEEQEVLAKEMQERQRRQQALAERQKQVQEEKRRQKDALRYSKGMLREGEEEIQKAMRVGKEGLLGHMAEEE